MGEWKGPSAPSGNGRFAVTLWVVGVNHRTAPIDVRERFYLSGGQRRSALEALVEEPGVREAVILSTCNRTEVYLETGSADAPVDAAARVLAARSGQDVGEAEGYLYRKRDRDAVTQLFRVASGLDSMVLGEAEIQGQVSDAYRTGREEVPESVDTVLHRLFQRALSAGSRVRTETALGEGAASVPSAAVHLAEKVFGSLEGRRTMVVGAGDMGALTVQCLADAGTSPPWVTSRTLDTAEQVAEEVGGRPVAYDRFWEHLGEVEILVACTAADGVVIDADRVSRALEGGTGPLVVLDIAVPRDVASEVGDLDDVFLYNVDDLQRVMESTEEARREETPRAEAVVAEEVDEFWDWYRSREAVPLIRAFRSRAEEIRRREIDELLEDLDGLDPEEREKIRSATRVVLNRLLHPPTVGLREMATEGQGTEGLEMARRLLGLDDETVEEWIQRESKSRSRE